MSSSSVRAATAAVAVLLVLLVLAPARAEDVCLGEFQQVWS